MRRMIVAVMVVLAMGLGCAGARAAEKEASAQPAGGPRIGVYDARAVAVAFVASPMHDEELKAKMAELKEAEAKGDANRAAELKAWGKSQQERRHLQGFAGTSVDDILGRVADRLPGIAQEAQVDAIVRKGEFVSKRADVVDLTDELVKVFEPTERTLKTIAELKKRKPIDVKAIERAERTGKI